MRKTWDSISVQTLKPLTFLEFKKRVWLFTLLAVTLPPSIGSIIVVFIGVYPFPEVFQVFKYYSGIYFFLVIIFTTVLTSKSLTKLQNTSPEELRVNLPGYIRHIPILFFLGEFFNFAGGVISANLSFSHFLGMETDTQFYLFSLFSIIPVAIIVVLPLFYMLMDTFGRYFGPMGINTKIATLSTKIILLGTLTPVMVDTLLLSYYYQRTGYLTLETVVLWSSLVFIASVSTYIAIKSIRQSMSPFAQTLLAYDHPEQDSTTSMVALSLDEPGLLVQNWKTLLNNLASARDAAHIFELVAQNTNQAIYIAELNTDIIYLNPALLSLLKRAEKNRHPKQLAELYPSPQRQILQDKILPMVHRTGYWVGEINQKIIDYEIPTIQNIFLLRNTHGIPFAIAGIITDMREQKMIEHDLQQYKIHLEEIVDLRTQQLEQEKQKALMASQAKSEFLSRMSHELRTPMNAILGFTQLIQIEQEDLKNPEHKTYISEIINAGNHLLTLINDILDISRIEAGKMKYNLEPVEIIDLTKECLNMLEHVAARKRITLMLDTTLKESWIFSDKTRIKQIMINLITNAIKYNRTNGTATIEIIPGDDDKPTRISVTDTGRGISRENIEKLFQPFERLGVDAEAIEGSGIGLTLSKRFAEQMHGTLGVKSVVNQGSTFWIEMPHYNNQNNKQTI